LKLNKIDNNNNSKESMLKGWFTQVDGGKGYITAPDLQNALKLSKMAFSLESCVLLIKMYDASKNS
jgi:hypothetical protein